jgi:integrase
MRNGHKNADVVNDRIHERVQYAQRLALQHPGYTPDQIKRLIADHPTGSLFKDMALDDLRKHPPGHHTTKHRGRAIERFAEWAPTITLEEINSTVMEGYKHHLLGRGVVHNTMATQLRMLRTVYNRLCRQVDHPRKDILQGCDAVHKVGAAPSRLNADEVKKLMAYAEGAKGWKAKAVHMWLFSFFCAGVRWTDLCLLRDENLKDGRVRYLQHKTGKPKDVELHPVVARIWEKYRKNGFVFDIGLGKVPALERCESCNAYANRMLKLAAAACGIEKRLHTHNARHSFADQAIEMNLDDRSIQAALAIDDDAYAHYKGQIRPMTVDAGVRSVLRSFGENP